MMYKMKVPINSAPPKRPSDSKKRMKSVKRVVRASKAPVYILADESNVIGFGEKIRPKEKAPRILEIEDPRILPNARGDWCCEIDATTTTSWEKLILYR